MTKRIENYFDNLLEVFSDGVYITNAKGKTITVNSLYEKLTGLKKEDIVGRLVTELVEEQVFNVVLNPIIVKTGQPQTAMQTTKAGRRVLLNGHPIFDKHGNVIFVITFVRDVTVLTQLRDQIANQARLIEKYHQEANALRNKGHDNNVIIVSAKMVNLMQLLKKIAKTDTTALILGETGVGKDVFARQIHENSPRANGPFFKINCATIPENLIESELFGYEPGAFSGASAKGKPGYFELADKGTLFLDELGELPLAMQAKLLRVLQDQEIMRVGSTKVRKVNVRIIAATNRNLEQSVKEGKFRSDLYYRLYVAVLDLPPLRERKEDILPLVDHFLNKFNTKYRKNLSFSVDARELLLNYSWPGNVRQIENMILGLIVTQDKQYLEADDLPCKVRQEQPSASISLPVSNLESKSLRNIMEQLEKDLLKQTLATHHNNVAKAAKALAVDRSTMFRKLKKYRLIS
ncbi:sigma 54-interacting transcriptional regulator [Peptococcaceae bacterium 1198_IL3148]